MALHESLYYVWVTLSMMNISRFCHIIRTHANSSYLNLHFVVPFASGSFWESTWSWTCAYRSTLWTLQRVPYLEPLYHAHVSWLWAGRKNERRKGLIQSLAGSQMSRGSERCGQRLLSPCGILVQILSRDVASDSAYRMLGQMTSQTNSKLWSSISYHFSKLQ